MDPEEGPYEEGKVLSPRELDITEKDGVAEIDDGRFVVSPDGTEPNVQTEPSVPAEPRASTGQSAPSAEPTEREPSASSGRSVRKTERALDRSAVRDWHERQLRESPCSYGYHLSLKAGSNVEHHTIHSDDVTMAFNNLLLWYARTVDADLPPGAVLGILLSDASVPVQYPVRAIEQLLMTHNLSTDDTIADLLAAIRDQGSVVFPPRTE